MQILVKHRWISVEDAAVTARALLKFAYNADHAEFAKAVYGREGDDYTLEKFKAMQSSLTNYMGSLDEAHLAAFVEAALWRLERKG